MKVEIDLVYPCHSKDKETLDLAIKYARMNIKNLRNIYVVSKDKLTDKAEWISENIFPFTFQDMIDKIGNHQRTGWYYAGWIHLLSSVYITGILDNVLICDSDTIFIKPVEFVDGNNKCLFNVSPSDGTPLYYEHMSKLIPGLTQQIERPWSGVAHHILIRREILKSMMDKSKEVHNKEFWNAWIDVTKEHYKSHINEKKYSGNERHEKGPGRATSYELYFNYAMKYFPNDVKVRKLNSIMAYKGFLNVEGRNYIKPTKGSRTNLRGEVKVVSRNIEENKVFKSLEDCLEFHIEECIKQGFESVTFQNHTRDGAHVKSHGNDR